MRTLERYLGRQIYAAVGFVFLGFLALFAFFDLIRELSDLGSGEYHLRQVFLFVLLSAPAHARNPFPRRRRSRPARSSASPRRTTARRPSPSTRLT